MKSWGISHVGLQRKLNEDAYVIRTFGEHEQAYFVVCDGMGGAKAGDVASRVALESFSERLESLLKPKMSNDDMVDAVSRAAAVANSRVWNMANDDERMEGMGTTLVALLVCDDHAVVCNIGDSRAYLIDEQGIRQITNDHSLVGEMIARGELSAEDAYRHPSRNVITRAIGAEAEVRSDVFSLRPKEGQFVLLCSDGLTGEVSEPEIYYEIAQSGTPETACKTLVDIANQRGGRDNITIVLVSF